MMSALGESVSFGRFLAEPLDWGKWSAFAHNRYLEEAARQSCPGSVAQKKALFEAHYARKRRMEADAVAEGGCYAEEEEEDLAEEEGGGASASVSAAGSSSSCMTDEAAAEQEVSLGARGDGLAGATAEQVVEAITDGIDFTCNMDEAAVVNEIRNTEESDMSPSPAKQEDSCNGHLMSADAAEERQPLKESSIVNQDNITDSAKKRRLQMPSLFQKPSNKLSSPSSSGKKGQSPSVKRRSALHSSKENASPTTSTDSSERPAPSVHRQRSTLAALHMSMSFSRCETGNATSCSRNLGTNIAERISQLQSATRPGETSQPQEFRSPQKVMSGALPEIAPRTSQVDKQRSSHVMRVKQMLFGSTSPSVTQKNRSTIGKQKKSDNEPGFNESRQSSCFKTRPLPGFCWNNKQAKDSKQQNTPKIQHLPNSSHLMSDGNHTHRMDKVAPKEKHIGCFPIRKMY